MKIAIIVRRLNTRGGTQRQALSLARELQRRGHEIRVYTLLYDSSQCYPELLDGLWVDALPGYDPKEFLRTGGYLNSLRQFRYDNRACQALAERIGHDTELLNPHDQLSYRVAYYFKRRVRAIPSVWMMNDPPTRRWFAGRESEFDSNRHPTLLKRFLHWMVDAYDLRFIRAQDRIMVLDNRDRDWVRQYFQQDALVVRSGVDLERHSFRERQIIPSQRLRLLMVGVFFPHRRFEDGLVVAALLRRRGYDIAVTVIGDYRTDRAYYQRLLERVGELGLADLVQFRGRVSDEELRAAFYEHDLFLFPSHLQSWGLAVFEAMAAGLPVVVSKTAGAAEVLTHGQNALLVQPRDPEAIAAMVVALLHDPDFYNQLSRNGRRFVELNISWPRYTDQLLAVFQSAVSKL